MRKLSLSERAQKLRAWAVEVKQLRSRLDISQEDLVRIGDVGLSSVRNWEQEKKLPSKRTMLKVREACMKEKERREGTPTLIVSAARAREIHKYALELGMTPDEVLEEILLRMSGIVSMISEEKQRRDALNSYASKAERTPPKAKRVV